MSGWSYRQALEAGDVDRMIEHFAPDVLLHSPATATPFRGRDEVAGLYREVFAALERWEVVAELGEGRTRALWLDAHLGGGDVTLGELFHLDDDGQIEEITITGRPLAGSALFFKTVGPRMAGRLHGARRGQLVGALAHPLPAALAAADRVGTRLAR